MIKITVKTSIKIIFSILPKTMNRKLYKGFCPYIKTGENMVQTQTRKIELEDEDFFEMLDAIQRVIGEEELPDVIEFRWRDGSKIIFEFKNNNWYKIVKD